MMTPKESQRMNWLCDQIQKEQDPRKFDQLINELNALLDRVHSREESGNPKPSDRPA
jgi:hypothetical protein